MSGSEDECGCDSFTQNVEVIREKLNEINVKLAVESEKTKQNSDYINTLGTEHGRMNDLLADHIKRTELLERSNEMWFGRMEKQDKRLEEALWPIRFFKMTSTVVIGGGALAAAIFGIIKLLTLIKG